jgi:hypothetical protein
LTGELGSKADHLSQRRLNDENRLLMNPTRAELPRWKPADGAIAVRISEIPESHCRTWDLPWPGYYQVDFFLDQTAGCWRVALLEWGALVNHKIGLAEISAISHVLIRICPLIGNLGLAALSSGL